MKRHNVIQEHLIHGGIRITFGVEEMPAHNSRTLCHDIITITSGVERNSLGT